MPIEPTNSLTYRTIGTIELAGAEIAAFDPDSQRAFATSGDGLQIVDLSDPSSPQLVATIDLSSGDFSFGNDLTSVAVFNGLVAVSVAAPNRTDPGRVFLLDTDGNLLASFEVGSLPDMVTFTPDGSRLLVANEGEATTLEALEEGAAYVNPVGSISVIDLSDGIAAATVQTIGFESFDDDVDALIAEGVRLFVNSPGFEGTSVAQDFEPEYIAIAPDGLSAMVTLQEANAIALIDLSGPVPVVTDVVALGLKDWSDLLVDTSDKDGIGFETDLPVFGMYMPDAIASYTAADGQTYYVMANEGDDRDDFVDESARLGDLDLDDTLFPDEAFLLTDGELGRLNVPALAGVSGDSDGDGHVDQILAYGARSFSIVDAQGNRVFDSGDEIDRFIAQYFPENYADGRSDNKGSEPEGVTIATIDGRTYAFITLERYNGTIVYDVTDPEAPTLTTFLVNVGDVSPESGFFVSAEDSGTGYPLFVVSNEDSGTLTVYELRSPETQGGNGEDDLTGTIIGETLSGGNGEDYLYANAGDDELLGGNGADVLDGGWGDDLLAGGRGDDLLVTGPGADIVLIERGGGADVATDFDPALDTVMLGGDVELARTRLVDHDGDGSLDLLLQFSGGGGSLVLLGVSDPSGVNII